MNELPGFQIGDHQQIWEYEEYPWEGPGPHSAGDR